jgi:hypothetical protein
LQGSFAAELPGGIVEIATRTRYPWEGAVDITIGTTIDEPWALSMRVPSWCAKATASVTGQTVSGEGADRIQISRVWKPGDLLRLELEMPPRITSPDPRIDAVRACVALERGPLVYAVEDADLPVGASVESLEIASPPNVEVEFRGAGEPGEMVWLSFDGLLRSEAGNPWPYGKSEPLIARRRHPTRLRALPYFAWGNRQGHGMRIWIPIQP